MRRKILAAFGALGLLAGSLSGAPALAQEVPQVVFSSDFEDGSTQGWFGRGTASLAASDAQAAAGTYSLLTTGRSANWHGPAYDVLELLLPRAVYRFDAQVRMLSGDPASTVQMTMQYVPESTSQTTWTQIAAMPSVGDQAWTQLSGEWSPAEAGFEMQMYVESLDPAVSFYVDEVVITMVEPPPDAELPSEETGTVDFGADRQRIDGFGFSEAFGRAALMNGSEGLSEENQQRVLDLLLNPETGIGFSILRLHIASTAEDSIAPTDPGGPDAELQYEWDGYDMGQVWLAKRAQEYGLERFYANPWSAPAYMKTNQDEANGGALCGLPGTDCDGEDWRAAFAEYLLQYVRFYADEGIEIDDLGFTNEPDWTASYSSMLFSPEQAVDFVNVLGPAIDAAAPSGRDLNLVCCDSFGWGQASGYSQAIEADPQAAQRVDIHSGHSYASRARSPLPTDAPTWMTEYALPSGTWVDAWDGGPSSGLALANDIHDTLTLAEVSAYITWLGASIEGTAAPIQLRGPEFDVAMRLYSTAAYSRFIRPDAYRVAADTSGALLKISAYRNADGGKVINVINNRDSEVTLDLSLAGVAEASHMVTYRTDTDHKLDRIGESIVGAELAPKLPPRSLTTFVIEDCATAVTESVDGPLAARSGLTCLADGTHVDGPVTVHQGAGLVAAGATVDGPLAATGAASVRLVGATVTGPVTVSQTTGGVVIAGSEVSGPMAVLANDTGFAPVVVSGNTVGGPLVCRGNAPAPVNQGVPNTVTGPATGQCQGL
jgi:O-glycosyl hydrolase